MYQVALSIAGSDPSGGAGIQADLKVFHQHGVYGTALPTLLTVQNSTGVKDVNVLAADFVAAQIQTLIEDIPPRAIKTGALGNGEIIDVVAFYCEKIGEPLIVDPIMGSTSGYSLLDKEGISVLRKKLLPLCYVVTPNLSEAEQLTETEVTSVEQMRKAARTISLLGPKNVIIKGGHLSEERAIDVVYLDGNIQTIEERMVLTSHSHGTGCAFSSALTARISRRESLKEAIPLAKAYVTEALRTNPGIGSKNGPLNFFATAKR